MTGLVAGLSRGYLALAGPDCGGVASYDWRLECTAMPLSVAVLDRILELGSGLERECSRVRCFLLLVGPGHVDEVDG
jgi:hypothetical protein